MKKKIYLLAIIGIILDQTTKLLITSLLKLNEVVNVINGFFSITYVRNTGAAWGMFSNNTLLLSIISILFLIFFIKYIEELSKVSFFYEIAFGLIVGGIVGNLIDRFFRGYVIDFFRFIILDYNYPIFNIADTLIVIGVIILIINFVRDDLIEKRK